MLNTLASHEQIHSDKYSIFYRHRYKGIINSYKCSSQILNFLRKGSDPKYDFLLLNPPLKVDKISECQDLVTTEELSSIEFVNIISIKGIVAFLVSDTHEENISSIMEKQSFELVETVLIQIDDLATLEGYRQSTKGFEYIKHMIEISDPVIKANQVERMQIKLLLLYRHKDRDKSSSRKDDDQDYRFQKNSSVFHCAIDSTPFYQTHLATPLSEIIYPFVNTLMMNHVSWAFEDREILELVIKKYPQLYPQYNEYHEALASEKKKKESKAKESENEEEFKFEDLFKDVQNDYLEKYLKKNPNLRQTIDEFIQGYSNFQPRILEVWSTESKMEGWHKIHLKKDVRMTPMNASKIEYYNQYR